ncbi:hypothetical protein GQ57_14275 [Burkholderia sp. MSh2]|uniref:Uncharacterized protein n=1 Tax=Burkholderia paludis TaxID=1506587 RepID=A0A6P2IKU6_9BURK|nr:MULTISPECIES: hypothetical protein [Burkholderia]KEZ05211.1 hypothetical protein GQ57_14275 [Burkholderia sp. MSh2]CAB3763453.1 hypothetical protein LMG30113_04451 [Burkholderia paludis]VWB31711.1 hypothetical protein BPA30113_01234 [Burkholderia paludis]
MTRPELFPPAHVRVAAAVSPCRLWHIACCIAACGFALLANAAELRLDGPYQRADGAITVRANGAGIDPYFAAKALLAASDAQLDTRAAALAWIAWLMPRQRDDGSFARYCVKNDQYSACAEAETDDAVMATWIELLARFAPPEGLPAAWELSLNRAGEHLDTLFDKPSGVYRVSSSLQVAWLMDNVEVHSAFLALSTYYVRRADYAHARPWSQRADRLAASILKVFWRGRQSGFRASTQQVGETSLYPAKVAQILPLLSDIQVPELSNEEIYAQWMRRYGKRWPQLADADYPWSLIGLVALKMNDGNTMACWHARSGTYRQGAHWNVLEETLYLAFESRTAPPVAPARCGFTTVSATATASH